MDAYSLNYNINHYSSSTKVNMIFSFIEDVFDFISNFIFNIFLPYIFAPTFAPTFAPVFIAFLVYLHHRSSSKIERTRNIEHTLLNDNEFINDKRNIKKRASIGNNCSYCKSLQMENYSLTRSLNMFSWLSNGVYYDFYDENYLFSGHATIIVNNFDRMVPYILYKQKNNYRTAITFCWLAVRWKSKRSLADNSKLDQDLKNVYDALDCYLKRTYPKNKPRRLINAIKGASFQNGNNLLRDAHNSLAKYYNKAVCSKARYKHDSQVCLLTNKVVMGIG